ncbi:cation/H(+) antiporter 15-like [Durio zibethinus]|uniref:Cation/H(+) antiporter 15-like n=1 Tax=Durio zibethinus TaxID=66656 RepID=A0A6P6BAW3_DURZI|nr:cation/H(+) antiporter 15-like [Durio zibethinus]
MVSAVDPDNIRVFGQMPNYTILNSSYVCSSISKLQRNGVFYSSNPLAFALPLLLIQMTLASAAILLTFFLVRPLGHPVMLAQILGGIIVGPSFLCRIPGLLNTIFPIRSFLLLDIVSTIGCMFYFFLIGVQTDISMLKKITRKTFAIGFFTMAVPMILTIGSSILWTHFYDPSSVKIDKLPAIAVTESVICFPIIAYYLSELRIINSEFGRVALCSSMVSTLCSLCVITSYLLWSQSGYDISLFFRAVCYVIAFAVLVCFILGPILLWEKKQILVGTPSKQGNIIVLFLAVLMSGFWGQGFGLNIYFGPLLFGLLIPSGPPLGSVLVEKLDLIIYWMLMPLYCVKFGLTVDIFALSIRTYSGVQLIALLGACGKFLGASISALGCQMSPSDAISLGFVMTFQGMLELSLFILMKTKRIIDGESFVAMCASLLITTGVITPMVRHFCNPSRRYVVYHGRTLMDSRPNSELRLLVCIHDQENVPSAISLLKALNPGKQSPIAVYMLHLIELTGSATPLFIPHKKTRKFSSRTSSSGPVINAFTNFEENHGGHVSIFPFISICPPQTMHDDVCAIALDKGISLAIIPFFKRFHFDGALQSSKRAMKIANQNVLDKAPCSVAILIDRGPLKTLSAIWTCWSSYEVAVIFLGGADDREALTLGARMAGLPNNKLTLIRILYDGNFPDNYMEGRRLDDEVLNDFRSNISGNYCAKYKEELVMDGAGTASVLRTLENQYELVVVGRRHDGLSPLLSGLREWNENRELGVIGDLLSSSDFLGDTTILVVQQHTDYSCGE